MDGRGGRIFFDQNRAPTMRHFLYLLYQPYKWLIVIPFLLLSTLFLGGVAIVIATTVSPKLASKTCGVWWSRFNSFMTPMFVSVRGRRHIDERQSYVIVSNHLSHYDIFVLYGWLGIDFKWIMKQELRKLPVVGIVCERLGHIYIDRSNTKAAVESINRAKKRVVNGTSVIFFPEGTRSQTGELLPFKKGAFKMARDLNLPILPVTIVGTNKILPTNSLDLFPGYAQMIIHPPVDINAYPKDNFKPLMEDVRSIIQSGILT